MRKVLLSGTALAVAAAVAVPAMAADADVTSGLQLKISGFVAAEAGLLISSANDGQSRDYDFNTNGRLQFDVKNVTDSGLEYGARIRMNNVNRDQDVTVDREYLYVKGSFGTLSFGDQPQTAGDFGYFFAPDTILNAQGGYGDNVDGNYRYGGGNFFSLDPTYQSGLDKSTSIKYASPNIGGLIFGVSFTPVIGADTSTSSGPTGRADLSDDDQIYENAISAGLGYEDTLDGTSVKIRGTASHANGIDGYHDLETYSLGAEIANGDIDASLVWVGTPSGFGSGQTDKDFNTVAAGLGYSLGAIHFGLGYAYTWAQKNNDLGQDLTDGKDLRDNHVAAATVSYTLAPGLNTYAEVVYEIQNFRKKDVDDDYVKQSTSWEQTTLLTGISVAF